MAAVAAAVAVVLAAVPAGDWLSLGKHAALLSVGLSQPQDSVHLLNEWVQRENAEPTEETMGTTVPTISLGEVQIQTAVTTAVPIGQGKIPVGGGTVLTQQLSSGSSFIQGVAVKNNYGKTVDIAAALQHTPALSFNKNETAPQVLITHTHTTECYLERDDGVYAPDYATRTTDETKNMVAVGEAVAAQLRMAGIGVIHDTNIHDRPYNGAYAHSKAEVERLLKENPTIRVVLDLHRDAIYPDDDTRVKPTVVIDGKKAAQVMIIVGMMNTKNTPNTHVQENLSFAVRLQQRLHEDHPGLMRPLNLANARYNQQLTNGSLLIEMGSDANTLAEAVYAGELVGKGLAQVLREL
jgi:stage II sporulation protein P